MKNRIMSNTNVKKLNILVTKVFSEYIENVEEIWHNDAGVQKAVKALCVAKRNSLLKKKDPNAPKRGKSAYLLFCADQRDAVKSDLGNESKATDVTKELGARWNVLKASTKAADKKTLASYEKSAVADKERYEEEKTVYTPPSDDEETKRRGGKKSVKTGPKRAKSAYLFFCAGHRDQVKVDNPEMKATEITSELGRLWNELKLDKDRVDEIVVFEQQAAEDKARYESEKTASKSDPKGKGKGKGKKTAPVEEEEVIEEVIEEEVIEEEEVGDEVGDEVALVPVKSSSTVTSTAKGKKAAVKKTSGKKTSGKKTSGKKTSGKKTSGKKTSGKKQNGYQAFCNVIRSELKEEFPKAKATEITKKLSAQWKSLSKDEQDKWKLEAARV